MEEKNLLQNEEVEIDLRRVIGAVPGKVWLIILMSILGAAIALAVTVFAITPLYKSAAMFYVNNNNISVGNTSVSISSSDIVASKNLVDSYIVILKSRTSLNDVIDYAGVNRTYSELKDMIEAASVNDTEIFQVEVTSPDPEEAERIANAIAYILPKRISSIIEGTSAKIVDSAVIPSKPSSPSYTKNTLIGFMLGFILTAGLIALREIFDITIRTEDDIAQVCKHPVLVSVPDMTSSGKGGKYEYSYDRNGQKKKKSVSHGKQPILMGKDISFAASEAYKMLRTKLQFSFADDESNCRVIGLSSALSGEGKSLSAVNLAYTLSQLNKKVILIDCDMRRPTLAEKLGVLKKPGLSSYLTGQSDLEGLLQYCNIPGDENAFHVIAAGENPPNPIELLSSPRMQKVVNGLRKVYDYVILDLPPVGEVSDAMAVAKITDGMLLVVRQNYCNRPVLSDAVHQFEFIDSKILGVVYNCASENNGRYGYGKGYYKRYYKKYYNKYGGYYAASKKEEK